MTDMPLTEPYKKELGIMDEPGWTKGPWLIASGSTVYALMQDGWHKGEPHMVNRFSAHFQNGGRDSAPSYEIEANARLGAAAPDLAEACANAEAVMTIVEPRSHKAEYLECLSQLRAALKLAREGRS
jgi:hypothetical protein